MNAAPRRQASKRRGLWVGGMVPLGYVSRDKKGSRVK
jgi:hypothetical protein